MTKSLALLRGINVGGKNKLPMKDLREVFEQVGCNAVKTYIQSGNVIFQASPEILTNLRPTLQQSIQNRFGFSVPVVLRAREELAEVIQRNPFLGEDPATLHVMFLADFPTYEAIAELDPRRSPPDSFAVVGREIYLHCPEGLAQSKLTNGYFDSKLGTISTCRNWRTTLKLLELADQISSSQRCDMLAEQ